MFVLGLIAVGLLISARLAPRIGLKAPKARFLLPALSAGILALMLTPTVWAAIPVTQGTQADLLVAGPIQRDGFGGNFGGRRDQNASVDSALIRYLQANQGNAPYLVATPTSMTADGLILPPNIPV